MYSPYMRTSRRAARGCHAYLRNTHGTKIKIVVNRYKWDGSSKGSLSRWKKKEIAF